MARRRIAALVALLGLFAVPVQSAHASTHDDVRPNVIAGPSPIFPEMYFDQATVLKDSAGRIIGYQLCAHGNASFLYVSGAWDYRMDGTRTALDGRTGPPVEEHDGLTASPYYDHCLNVLRLGYQTGHVDAT